MVGDQIYRVESDLIQKLLTEMFLYKLIMEQFRVLKSTSMITQKQGIDLGVFLSKESHQV